MIRNRKLGLAAALAVAVLGVVGPASIAAAETAAESSGTAASASWLVAQREIAGGDRVSCAVTITRGVQCWGFGYYGSLGNGANTDSSVPVDVVGLGEVVQISGREKHFCAVTRLGAAKCWGANSSGQLGNNSTTDSNVPVEPQGLGSGVAQISAGETSQTCALMTSGAVKCWGVGQEGALGNGSDSDSLVPSPVLSSGAVAVQTTYDNSCALMSDHTLKCWGANGDRQLGDGTTTTKSNVPVTNAAIGADVKAFAIAYGRICWISIATTGVKCLGGGIMGDGATTNSLTPVNVAAPLNSGVVAITGLENELCALKSTGAVYCWGDNSSGQIGDGTTTDRNTPTLATGLASGVIAVTHGQGFVLAVRTDGTMTCWGSNSKGQFGTNDEISTTKAVASCGITVPLIDALPATGANTGVIVRVAMGLLGLGAVLLLVRRRGVAPVAS